MERRQHRRIPLNFPLQIRIADLGKFSEECAKDLSEGGIFIPMDPPLPEQSDVELEFRLEEEGRIVRARGKVVRCALAEEDRPAGMAIAFTRLGKDARRLIERLVRRYSRRRPSEATPMHWGGHGRDEAILVRLESGPLPYFEVAPDGLAHRNDEIFVRVPERPDTAFTGAPSYSVAVRDCLDLGGGDMLLKVRPDMHRRIFSELRAGHDAYRVYGVHGDASARFALLDRLQIDRGDSHPPDVRVRLLDRYCLDVPPDGGPPDAQYVLRPELALDPLASIRAVQEGLPLAEISPIVIRLVDWIPRSRQPTDLIPLAEVGPSLRSPRTDE